MKYAILLIFTVAVCMAKDKPQHAYQDGILVSSSDHSGTFLSGGATPASSVLIPTHNWDVVIAVGGMAYTGQIGSRALPPETIFGDSVKVFIENDKMYFVVGGKEFKARIIQRSRYKP